MWLGNISALVLALGFAFGLKLHWLLSWLVGVNVVAFVLFGLDKRFARNGRWRISEADLLYYTLIGGTLGSLSGMKLFRHKTRKQTFRRWYWGIVGLQVLAVIGWGWLKFGSPSA